MSGIEISDVVLIVNTIIMSILTFFVYRATKAGAAANKRMCEITENIATKELNEKKLLSKQYIFRFISLISTEIMPEMHYQSLGINPKAMDRVFNYSKLADEEMVKCLDDTELKLINAAYSAIDTYILNYWKNSDGTFKSTIRTSEYETIKKQSYDLYLILQDTIKKLNP